jgi:hypothetical protein
VQSRPTRRTVMQLIAGQALATSVGAAQLARVQNNAPNVVFVLADDVGYGDLAASGIPTSRRRISTACMLGVSRTVAGRGSVSLESREQEFLKVPAPVCPRNPCPRNPAPLHRSEWYC